MRRSDTPSTRVLEVYPAAVCGRAITGDDKPEPYFIAKTMKGPRISGEWPTEAEAWADAADRLYWCDCGADNMAWSNGAAYARATHSDNCAWLRRPR